MLHIMPGLLTLDGDTKIIDMVFGEREHDEHVFDDEGNLKKNPCYVPDCCIRYNSLHSAFFNKLGKTSFFPVEDVEAALKEDKWLPHNVKARLNNLIDLAKKRRANVIYIA